MKYSWKITYRTFAAAVAAVAALSIAAFPAPDLLEGGNPPALSGAENGWAFSGRELVSGAAISALASRLPDLKDRIAALEETDPVTLAGTEHPVISAHAVPVTSSPSADAYDNLAVANVKNALNLRAEPSTEAKVLGTCFRGGGGRVLERREGWTKIRSGGLEGWLKDDYLVFGRDIQPLAKELGLFTAKVTTQTLNVRDQPTTDSDIVGLAAGDDYYPVLEESDGWAKIQLSADTSGYISCDYASIQVTPGRAVSIEAELAALEGTKKEKEKKKEAEKPAYVINASEDDIYLMAACITMEAGSSSYESQLAVGNVIVNRVKSGQWGSSISDVIYAKGQFPGATSGLLDKYLAKGPSSSALKAAKAALSGTNQIGDYLYFTSTKSADYGSYSKYIVVGGNCFYKK